jgi:uncharacterized damage-inducible protein DinB
MIPVENAWWITEWGNPCRECGFDWAQPPATAIAAVEELPDRLDALLAGRTGNERAPDAHPREPIWSAKAYVFHVADNLRIFAERLEGVFAGAPTTLAAYDQDELAAARNYDAMSLESALWSVRAATAVWAAATREALTRLTTYQHSERGELNAAEITRGPAHDALHHFVDVTRAVQ